MSVRKTNFEWDEEKDRENQEKHKVSFIEAQQAFFDPHRVIVEDMTHSSEEDRYYYRKVHLPGQYDSHLWCRLLEERKENL